ncbi:DGQHR domain-containing protein [Endozoicomonas sp. ALC020]|uniref:DGQHR domain-containing protein n=1 Tax=unclassified Endozoicomonas TaxID=2644528 RepID=UPI003BB16F06
MSIPFLETPALSVTQPLGQFYIASIRVEHLLKVTYSAPASIRDNGLSIEGTQRLESEKRLKEIADYIRTKEAAFPNAIIIGANYKPNGEYVGDDDNLSWKIEDGKLIIPTGEKLGSIIDGQHRLHAFEYCEKEYLNVELLCAIYTDLPVPFHAYLFSTINFNQKKVDRSLAYNLFGFDIESSDENTWVPETLAVSIVRRLNVEDTPLKSKITLGMPSGNLDKPVWSVSMATIVDGVLKLISKNPKKDRHDLLSLPISKRSRSELLSNDGTPLRFLYIDGYDEAIYEIVRNYFMALNSVLWNQSIEKSYIVKTVGIQASFDFLKELLFDFHNTLDGSETYFSEILKKASDVDFTNIQASGIGRTQIRNLLLIACGVKSADGLGVDLSEIPYNQLKVTL